MMMNSFITHIEKVFVQLAVKLGRGKGAACVAGVKYFFIYYKGFN